MFLRLFFLFFVHKKEEEGNIVEGRPRKECERYRHSTLLGPSCFFSRACVLTFGRIMGKKSKRVRRKGGQAGRQQQQPQQLAVAATTPALDDDVLDEEMMADLRLDLDRNMQEFDSLPLSNPWNKKRTKLLYYFYLFSKHVFDMQLHELMEEQLLFVPAPVISNALIMFVRKIATNQAEPAFFRCLALMILGMLCFVDRDSQGMALQSFDDAFGAIDSLSDTEKKQIVHLENDSVRSTVGALLARMKGPLVAFLNGLDRYRIGTWNPTGVFVHLPYVAGLLCDCCQEHRGESILMVCERCQLAHFCSRQCQRKAWKEEGHKMVCRKKGEFRVGDVAASIDPFGYLTTGHPVRLKALAVNHDHDNNNHSSSSSSASQEWWHVESTLEDDDTTGMKLTKTIAATRLMNVRPGLWNIVEKADWDEDPGDKTTIDDSDLPNLTMR